MSPRGDYRYMTCGASKIMPKSLPSVVAPSRRWHTESSARSRRRQLPSRRERWSRRLRVATGSECRAWYIAGVRASDTTPASHAAQMEVYRRLGPTGRVRLAARLSADTREIARAGIRSRHPGYTQEEVDLALRRLLYGDDLV